MSAYQEFTGKSVEEALRLAREEFGVDLDGLDFEILTPGSRGVLGMGAEPARILAAPRAALGGAAPKLEAAAARPLPPAPPRQERDRGPRREGGFGRDRERGFERDRGPRREGERDRGARPDRPRIEGARAEAPQADRERGFERDRGPRRAGGPDRGPRRDGSRRTSDVTEREAAEVAAARSSTAVERAELEAAEASPETLAAGARILAHLVEMMGFEARVEVETGDTSRLNVVAEGDEREALGALIGRKGERLSALQHIVNLLLSKELGDWTRVLVDVEDYRGRRERQLREIAERAAARVAESGRMLQLEPMPALERRWVHLALRGNPAVTTQSIGEEPDRRIVILPRLG
jgi:spoIIIJ-associated protein